MNVRQASLPGGMSGPTSGKLLVVDGHNLLFQMYYGMPTLIIGRDGRAVQGTWSFVGALLRVLKMVEPTHAVVLFDGEHPNDRSTLDSAYKANRCDYTDAPDEDNPFSQLSDVYAALDCLGIRHCEVTEGETDDMTAFYIRSCPEDWEAVICSQDSDFFQLIGPQVRVLRYRGMGMVLCDSDRIQQMYGVFPAQYADFKALTGDASDHIKGLPSVGPKTAAALLSDFGTLRNLLDRVDTIRRPALRETVRAGRERLLLNQRLIRLDRDLPLPFSLDELACSPAALTTVKVLERIGVM